MAKVSHTVQTSAAFQDLKLKKYINLQSVVRVSNSVRICSVIAFRVAVFRLTSVTCSSIYALFGCLVRQSFVPPGEKPYNCRVW
jgi:hypothetical protein